MEFEARLNVHANVHLHVHHVLPAGRRNPSVGPAPPPRSRDQGVQPR